MSAQDFAFAGTLRLHVHDARAWLEQPPTCAVVTMLSATIPKASDAASAGADAALSLPRFRGRKEADDSGLVCIALMAAGNI